MPLSQLPMSPLPVLQLPVSLAASTSVASAVPWLPRISLSQLLRIVVR